MARVKTGVLISGTGSNLRALLAAAEDPSYPAEISHVISNRPEAPGLAHADAAGVSTSVIEDGMFASRPGFEAAITESLRAAGVELVIMAGFMRVLTTGFVDAWWNRALNIHPSLLPAFPGRHTHEQALAAGVRVAGCTVHFLREAVDAGPIVGQAAVPVHPDDTSDTLGRRVGAAEHRLLPHCLRLIAGGRARVEGERVRLDGSAVPDDPMLNPLP